MLEDSRKPTSVKEIYAADLAPQMYEVWSLHYYKTLPDWSKMPELVRAFWIDKANMALEFSKLESFKDFRSSNILHVDILYGILAFSEPESERVCWTAVSKFLLKKLFV